MGEGRPEGESGRPEGKQAGGVTDSVNRGFLFL